MICVERRGDVSLSARKVMLMINPTAYIAQGAVVVGDVSLGKETSIWYNSVLRGDIAPVRIGDQTNIQDLSMVHVDERLPCSIGNRVSVGHRAILHGCTVEDECLIGMGAVLLNGVHLGAGSLVGAGAVILQNTKIPPGSLVLGFPAQITRSVDDALRSQIESTWKHYVKEAHNHRSGKVFQYPADAGRRLSDDPDEGAFVPE